METIHIFDDAASRLLQEADGVTTIVADNGDEFDFWDKLRFNTTANGPVHGATDIEVSAVITSLGVNTVIFLLVLSLYEVVWRMVPSVYRSNRRNTKAILSTDKGGAASSLPLPFSWVPSIMRVSWSQVRHLCGMEAYFFLRYIRLCFQVTAVSGLWGTVVLWPIYASGGNGAHGWYHLSMANLESGSWRLWFPTMFMCFLTFYVIFLMNEEYKHYVDCRMEFLAKGDAYHVHPQQRYSLMVEDIPNELRSDKALHDYFEELFPGRVHSTCLILNVPDLQELCNRRNFVLRRLEKCQAILEIAAKRPHHKVGSHKYLDVRVSRKVDLLDQDARLPSRGERVDSINYYTKYLQILNERVAEKQQDKMTLARKGDNSRRASEWISHSLGLSQQDITSPTGDGDGFMSGSNLGSGICFLVRRLGLDFFFGGLVNLNRPLDVVVDTMVGRTLTSTGFVTFTDLVTVTCAVRAPLSHEAGVLSVEIAPDARDVVWENAHIGKAWSSGREWTTEIIFGLGAILWSVPVTAIQALANLKSLSTIPGLSWISHAATGDFAAFLNGYLPVIALIALIAALPPIFTVVAAKYERRKSQSDIQHSVLKRFFYYQLANVYVTVTAGSILDSLAEILDHPSNAFAILGESVPTVVGYFVMFVMTKILAGLPFILLQVGPLLKRTISTLMCRDRVLTQRELDEEYQPIPLDLGQEYPNQLLIIVIMFTYATISPVILPVGALYFLAAFVVYKKQLLLVFSSTYESGGVFFPTACHRTLVGLVAAQVTLIGYTVLRQGFYQPLVLLPLPFYTVAMMTSFKHLFEDPGKYLSLERAIDLDKRNVEHPIKFFDATVYRQPNLVPKDLEAMPYRRAESDQSDAPGAEVAIEKVV